MHCRDASLSGWIQQTAPLRWTTLLNHLNLSLKRAVDDPSSGNSSAVAVVLLSFLQSTYGSRGTPHTGVSPVGKRVLIIFRAM